MREEQRRTWWFGWWGWYTDRLEAWLEAKALAGWHVTGADCVLMRFRFVQGGARHVRYCADYQASPNAQYRTLFQDAGWGLIAEGHGWYVWRMEYVGERPEIISDLDSLLDRNHRLARLVAISMLLQLPALLTVAANSMERDMAFARLFLWFFSIAMAFDLFCLISLGIRNREVRERKR